MATSNQYKIWVDSFKSKLGELDDKVGNFSIFRVPSKLKKLNKDAYNPSMVSIGPFHRNIRQLQWMEGFKWQYTLLLLNRTISAEATFDKCAQAINDLEKDVRGYYMEDLKLNRHKLNEILLVDGCFILELLIRYSEGVNKVYGDPIISNEWVLQALQHDLALLENQIPFVVLQKLFNIIVQCLDEGTESLPHSSVTAYVLRFFQSALGRSVHGELRRTCCDQYARKHLLDILHKFLLPATHQTEYPESTNLLGFRLGATELLKSGVRIEVDHQPNNLLDVKFKDGVLTFPTFPTLPTVKLAESILSNLVAYEQSIVGSSNHVTPYAGLIGSLIRNRQDIDSLKRKGVIVVPANSIDNEIVSNLFLNDKGFPYGAMCDDVNAYRRHWLNWGRIKASLRVRWRGYILTLRGDYFTNPWTILSVIAAVVLLALTILQTFYTVRSYYPR